MGVQKFKHNLFLRTTKKTNFKDNKENQNKKTKILLIPPHLKHNIVLNVEIKEKEYKRMTNIK